MTIKKKLSNLTENQKKELKGFEEVVDLVIEDSDRKEIERSKKDIEKRGDLHELYNFLEHEKTRLSRIDSFFSSKVDNLGENAQTQVLIKRQYSRIEQAKETLLPKLSQTDSSLQKQLRQIFNSAFK